MPCDLPFFVGWTEANSAVHRCHKSHYGSTENKYSENSSSGIRVPPARKERIDGLHRLPGHTELLALEIVCSNQKIIADSGEGYVNRQDCYDGIELVMGSANAPIREA